MTTTGWPCAFLWQRSIQAGKPFELRTPNVLQKLFPITFETYFDLVQPQTDVVPVICIDGPTASGKGTLAFEIAKTLGFHYCRLGGLVQM
jgi:3-phosphoshikimate 1-carboxyvinyltransferase